MNVSALSFLSRAVLACRRVSFPVRRMCAAGAVLMLGAAAAAAQITLQTAIGSTSSQQSATLTFGASGNVATMTFFSEGRASTEFQLSGTASTCTVNRGYSQNNTCTVNYTFQPRLPGVRHGAVVLADINGNRLATAYLSGRGTGPQGVFYPTMPITSSAEQQLLGLANQQPFDRDEDGNFYFLQQLGGGLSDAVLKESPNGDGTYTGRTIAYEDNSNLPGGGIAVDGAGNVFYTYSYNPGQGSCYIFKLSPNNNGYTKSAIWTGSSGAVCMNQLKADIDGSLYVLDTNGGVQKFVYNGTGWNSFQLGSVALDQGTTFHQLDVDSSGNVFVAIGGTERLSGNTPFAEFAYNPSTPGTYTRYNNPGLTLNGTLTTAAYGVAVAPDDSLYISQGSRVLRAVPTGAAGQYTASIFFTSNRAGAPQAMKVDGAGNLYMDYIGSTSSGIVTTIPHVTAADFGTVNSGSSSNPSHFLLLNTGNAPLAITATGAITPFTLYADTPASLDCAARTTLTPGGTCELSMLFAPLSTSAGPYSTTAYVYDNHLNGSAVYQAITLTGTANHPLPTLTSLSPASGDANGGQTIVITGTAFSDVTKVVFNSGNIAGAVSVPFTINSATQITARTPNLQMNNGGTAAVIVTNPAGSASGTFTYNAPASATKSTLVLATPSVPQGALATVVATVNDANGNPLTNATIVLSSSNQTVATGASQVTDGTGSTSFTLTGLAPGSTTLTATVVGISLSQAVTLTVTPPVVAVGSSVSGLLTNVVITTPGTVATVLVVTNGTSGADFATPGGSCAVGTTYASGALCSVSYNFTPSGPGLRAGAVILEDSTGTVLGETLIRGTGTGPLALITPGVERTLTTDGTNSTNDAVFDGAGNLFTGANNGLSKVAPNGSRTYVDYHSALGLAMDGAGNLFYTDGTNIYELVNATGSPLIVATFTQNAGPAGPMAVDGFGNLYAGLPNGSIVKLAAGTFAQSTVATVSGALPYAIAVDSAGNVFFDDPTNRVIYRIPAGSATATPIVTGIFFMRGLAVDAGGNLFLGSNAGIQRFAAGTYTATTLSNTSAGGLRIDGQGTLLAANSRSPFTLTRSNGPTLNFTTNVGSSAGPQTLTLENAGNTNLSVSGVSVAPDAFSFTTSSSTRCTASTVLASGAAPCDLSIVFTPTAAGSFYGLASVVDNSLNTRLSSQGAYVAGTAYGTQTITFAQPVSPATAGSTVTLNATASSGLPVTFTVTAGQAQINGNQLTYTGSGSVTVTASQPGNTLYAAAPSVARSVLVSGISSGVGSSNATPQTVTLTFTTAGTIAAINALTQGAPNKDFRYASGSSSANACVIGTAYSVGATCTVAYTFTPTRSGSRLGAVTLTSSASAVLASTAVFGTGVGPLAVFPDSTALTTFTGSSFSVPNGMAVDGFGNVIVVDTGNYLIKRIAATGGVVSAASAVTTLSSTNIVYPTAVAVAGNGDIFLTSLGDGSSTGGLVQKLAAVNGVVPAGAVPVTVSNGFNQAQGLAFDASGNLFVADTFNNKIKEIVAVNGSIPASPTVTTVVNSQISSPRGIALNANGDLFIASPDFSNVLLVTATNGSVSTSSTISYLRPSNGLVSPFGVALDGNGNLYIADIGSQVPSTLGQGAGVFEMLAVNGTVVTGSPALTLASGMQPRGLALDGLGHVFVADTNNNAAKMIDLTTAPALAFANTAVTASTAAKSTRVENSGNAPLAITALTTSKNFALDASSTTCSTSSALGAGSLCSVGAVFAPQSSGALSGTLTLADNSGYTSATQQVVLTGTGITGSSAQSVSFAQPVSPVVNGAAPIALSASATSGLPVTFTVSGPGSVSGNLLSITGAGTLTITATQAGNGTYASATPVSRTVIVSAASSSYAATEAAVGSSQTLTATLTFTAAATLSSSLGTAIQVTTQGAAGLDFNYASGGTCAAGTSYALGQACTVQYTFSPTAAGLRRGAIVLASNDSTPVQVAVSFLSGIGDAPVALFTAGSETTIATLNTPRSPVVDAAGNLLVSEQGTGTLFEFSAGSSTPTTLVSGVNGLTGTTIDGAGHVFYASSSDSKIYQVENGSPVAIASIPTPDNNLVADGAGNLYVTSDAAGLYKIAAKTHAVATVVAGGAAVTGGTMGRTIGMTIDSAGILYLADYASARLYAVNPATGAIKTIASGGPWLSNPHGLAVDAAGNLYVTNNSGSTSIVKYTLANGVFTPSTLANSAGAQGAFAVPNGDLVVVNGNSLSRYSRQSSPTVSFPSTALNQVSAAQSVGIENDGNTALNLAAVSLSANFGFGANTCTPASTIAAGASCSLSITFAPSTVGMVSGTATLTSNSAGIAGSLQTVPLTGTATQGSQTITFSPASPLVYTAGLSTTLSATASSGLPVTFSIVSGPATLSGSVLTVTGAGTVIVQASQAGDSNYLAAPAVQGSITVLPGSQTLSFTLPVSELVYTAGMPVYALGATSSAGLPVAYTVSGPATVQGATLTITGPGTVSITARQPGDGNIGAATSRTLVLTVDAKMDDALLPSGVAGTARTITVTMPSSFTLGSISTDVAPLGAGSSQVVSGGTCAIGTTYNAGDTCTVQAIFTPAAPGLLSGTVRLLDSSGNVVVTLPLVALRFH